MDEHGITWTNMEEHGRTWNNMVEPYLEGRVGRRRRCDEHGGTLTNMDGPRRTLQDFWL